MTTWPSLTATTQRVERQGISPRWNRAALTDCLITRRTALRTATSPLNPKGVAVTPMNLLDAKDLHIDDL
jgi:hypothetical protein